MGSNPENITVNLELFIASDFFKALPRIVEMPLPNYIIVLAFEIFINTNLNFNYEKKSNSYYSGSVHC